MAERDIPYIRSRGMFRISRVVWRPTPDIAAALKED